MTGHLTVVDSDATRIITLTRADKKNALTQDMYRAMAEAINSAQHDAAIRCLVIEGSGGIFTSGNDLEDFLQAGSAGAGLRESQATTFLHALANNQKPLLAAVGGAAIGIGTTLLFHCDYVIASSTASFATPFVPLGLVPEGASSLLVPRAIGHHRAFALLVMGRKIDANDARDAGFVNEVVPPEQLRAEARKVAAEICRLPAEAVALSRQLLKLPAEQLIERIDHEGRLFGERMTSDEAIAAFKRFFDRKK
ncbi:MAG TPA: enoyl-CoA hydratase-related protein [Rhodopseudomonas sp.]|uniref:enoyl-CoA hydratase-related protein n=1 Tax=Rhodopseudomonas sp. TaxID=1078 RepID=UPI002EDA4F16